MGLTSQIKQWYIRHLPGMNNKAEERELQDKFVVQAQNLRFEDDPGGIRKRDAVAQFKEKQPEYAKKYDALFGNDSGAGNYNFPSYGEGGSMGMPNYNMGNPGNAGGFYFNGGRQSTMPDTRGGNFPQGPIDNELIAQNMDYNVDEMMMNLRKS